MENFNDDSEKRSFNAQEFLSWVTIVLLALSLVYSLLYVAAQLGVSFFVLDNRSMDHYTVSSDLLSADLDGLVWGGAVVLFSAWFVSRLYSDRGKVLWVFVPLALAGLAFFGWFGLWPLVFAAFVLAGFCLVFSGSCFGVSWFSVLKRLVEGAVFVGVFVEAAALVLFNVPFVLNVPVEASAVSMHWWLVELSLSNLTYPFLPFAYLFLVVLGVAAFLWKVLSVTFAGRWKDRRGGFLDRLRGVAESSKAVEREPFGCRFPVVLAVLISVAVSVVLVVVTVLPWINPTYRLVSVDAPSYYEWLVRMRGLDAGSALSFALANDRAAFLVLDYALSFVAGSVNILQLIPILLVPLLCIASLSVIRRVCRLRDSWVYSLFLAPLSVPALGLIYSGYFANMLAVVFVYFSFVLLLVVFRSGSTLAVCGLLGTSLIALFAHSWTWYVFAFSLVAFLFWEWRLAVRDRGLWKSFKWKLNVGAAIVVAGLVCDVARKLLTSSSISVAAFETAKSSLGFPDMAYVLGELRLTTNFYLGGVFANGMFIVLCVVGFLFLLSFKSEMSRLLVSWVFVACVPVLFASGEFVFNRFLFLLPSVVFSGLGLCFLVRCGINSTKGSHTKKLAFELLIVGFVVLVLLNFGLRYVSNINIV